MKKAVYIFSTLFILCVSFSCLEDVDFSQAEDFFAEPSLAASLAFFDEPANTFIANPGVSNVVIDTVAVDIFTDDFVVDNLIKAELFFETTNSINNAFIAQIDFYNDVFELQNAITIDIPASPLNTEDVTEDLVIFEDNSLEAFKQSTQIVFTLTLVEDVNLPPIDNNTLGRIIFKSSGTFFFRIGGDD